MVADTKNRRGRPKIFFDGLYSIYFDKEKRTAQNMYYVGEAVKVLGIKQDNPFWITSRGNFKNQGILEQIGRMYDQDGYTEEQCKSVAETAVHLKNNGYKVKAIESWIRNGRITGEW